MKICPECHKISTDDDFCSNCGAAVFGADDVTDSRAIDCDRMSGGHDHSKVTYDISERGTRINYPQPGSKLSERDQKTLSVVIVLIIIIFFCFMVAPFM